MEAEQHAGDVTMAFALDIENVLLTETGDKLGHMIIAIVNALVARGWVVRGSGDGGSAFQNLEQTAGPYNVFTSGPGYLTTRDYTFNGTNPNTITKPRAWVRIKEPGASTREIVIQRSSNTAFGGTANLIVRMAIGGYTGGGAAANAPPSAPGGDIGLLTTQTAFNAAGFPLWETTTVATPGYTVPVTAERFYLNMLVETTARASDVWPFYLWLVDSQDQLRVFGWIYESLLNTMSTDTQPWVSLGGAFDTVFGSYAMTAAAGSSMVGYVNGAALTDIKWNFMGHAFGNWPGGPASFDPNVRPGGDGKWRALPAWVASSRNGMDGGMIKGRMEHALLNPLVYAFPNTIDVASPSNPRIALNRLLVEWKQNVVPAY